MDGYGVTPANQVPDSATLPPPRPIDPSTPPSQPRSLSSPGLGRSLTVAIAGSVLLICAIIVLIIDVHSSILSLLATAQTDGSAGNALFVEIEARARSAMWRTIVGLGLLVLTGTMMGYFLRRDIVLPILAAYKALKAIRSGTPPDNLPTTRFWEMQEIYGAIEDLHHHEQALSRLATIDPLTAIANRRHFMEEGQAELSRSLRYDHPMSVAVFDIDHFKGVNDTYGHACGDEVIRAVARASLEHLRNVDTLGRIGGEEFAVILPETTLAAAAIIAERIRAEIADMAVHVQGLKLSVTISIGIAEALDSDQGIEAPVHRADAAMYAAKRNGRNQVVSASLDAVSALETAS